MASTLLCHFTEHHSCYDKSLVLSLLSLIILVVSSHLKVQPAKSVSENKEEGVALKNARGTCFTLRDICNDASCHQTIQDNEQYAHLSLLPLIIYTT